MNEGEHAVKGTAGLAGMIGTTLFTLSFTIHGFLRSDYNPIQRYVSELSIGSSGWIQMVSFLILGICIMIFAFGVRVTFPTGKASRSAPILLMIIGISYVLSGVFVTDPQAMFNNQKSIHGIIHGIVGSLVFSLSAACCFALWRRFRIDELWRSLSVFSLASGVVMTILIVLIKIGQLHSGFLHDWAGVVQRCCLITSYAWIIIISYRMRKLH